MKSLNDNLWNNIEVEVMEDREEFAVGRTIVPECYKCPCDNIIKPPAPLPRKPFESIKIDF